MEDGGGGVRTTRCSSGAHTLRSGAHLRYLLGSDGGRPRLLLNGLVLARLLSGLESIFAPKIIWEVCTQSAKQLTSARLDVVNCAPAFDFEQKGRYACVCVWGGGGAGQLT